MLTGPPPKFHGTRDNLGSHPWTACRRPPRTSLLPTPCRAAEGRPAYLTRELEPASCRLEWSGLRWATTKLRPLTASAATSTTSRTQQGRDPRSVVRRWLHCLPRQGERSSRSYSAHTRPQGSRAIFVLVAIQLTTGGPLVEYVGRVAVTRTLRGRSDVDAAAEDHDAGADDQSQNRGIITVMAIQPPADMSALLYQPIVVPNSLVARSLDGDPACDALLPSVTLDRSEFSPADSLRTGE